MKIPRHSLDKEIVASSTKFGSVINENATVFSSGVASSGRHAASSVLDVAKYILQEYGTMTTMKLQKLVYYAQAWSLVWDEVPLFNEKIEAWANGPVVRSLYNLHRRLYTIDAASVSGNPDALSKDAKETIDAVVRDYGCYSGGQLSEIVHSERPWLEARKGLLDGARSEETISLKTMKEFYSSL